MRGAHMRCAFCHCTLCNNVRFREVGENGDCDHRPRCQGKAQLDTLTLDKDGCEVVSQAPFPTRKRAPSIAMPVSGLTARHQISGKCRRKSGELMMHRVWAKRGTQRMMNASSQWWDLMLVPVLIRVPVPVRPFCCLRCAHLHRFWFLTDI